MNSIFRICIPAIGCWRQSWTAQQRSYRHGSQATVRRRLQPGIRMSTTPVWLGGQSNITDATQRAVLWARGTTTPILIGHPA